MLTDQSAPKSETSEPLGLYRFYVDCGRNGALEGVFVTTSGELEDIQGKLLYFEEVLGKHSYIEFDFELSMVSLITKNPEFISEWLESTGSIGVNPLNYVDEDDYEAWGEDNYDYDFEYDYEYEED